MAEIMSFILAGCCMTQHLRCLSGRASASCEKMKDVSVTLDIKTNESNGVKTQKDTNQSTLQPLRECKAVE